MTDSGTLRDQQADFTRQMVMEAAKRVIDTYPIEEFTIQKIADEAGMSHRTVYRYYPTRQALLDAFTDWIEDVVAPLPENLIEDPDDVTVTVRLAFDRFDQYAPYFRAGLILASQGEPLRPHRQKDRDRQIREELAGLLEPLEPERAEEVYAVLRHLLGAHTWHVLHDRFQLHDGRAGESVAWALEVLIEAIKNGNHPKARVVRDTDE